MENRKEKIKALLSLIRKTEEHLLTVFRRDESGKKIIVSQTPIESDRNLEIELVPSGHKPANSEDEIEY